jgi:hypothetical protein
MVVFTVTNIYNIIYNLYLDLQKESLEDHNPDYLVCVIDTWIEILDKCLEILHVSDTKPVVEEEEPLWDENWY